MRIGDPFLAIVNLLCRNEMLSNCDTNKIQIPINIVNLTLTLALNFVLILCNKQDFFL